MKDVFGTEIEVGQFVAFGISGYADLFTGIVERLTPKMVVVRHATCVGELTKIGSSVYRACPSQIVVRK